MTIQRNWGVLLISTILMTAACTDTKWKTRVASVGSASAGEFADDPGDEGSGDHGGGSGGGGTGGTGGGSGGTGGGASGQGNLIVASGNVLIGAAGQYAKLTSSLNGSIPAGGVINGKVSAILLTSGHTVVQLGTGTSVLLKGTGGKLGDVVAIDFGKGRVIGGPSSLIGINVLAADPHKGSLATVSVASANKLVGVTVLKSGTDTGSLILAPQVASSLGLESSSKTTTSPVTIPGISTVKGVLHGGCC